MIKLRNVSLSIKDKRILSDIDLDCAPGTVTALCGPNGAGKSTLLAVIADDVPPDTGTVDLQDTPLSKLSVRALAQIRSVFPQGAPIRFGYTVEEVVAMGRAFRDLPPDEDARAIDCAMEEAEVAHLAYRNAQTLSGGEKARVTFARVRVQETAIVMLDEPTAALDLRHQEKVLLGARAMAAGGATVIVVLHDLNLAAVHSDRIVLMEQGRIAALGTPEEVLTEETVSRVYRQDVCILTHPRRGCPVVLIT